MLIGEEYKVWRKQQHKRIRIKTGITGKRRRRILDIKRIKRNNNKVKYPFRGIVPGSFESNSR